MACTWWLNQQGQRPSQIALAAFAATDVKKVSPTGALQVLRRRAHVPEPNVASPIEQPAGGE